MTNELQVFQNPAFGQVRGVEIDGEPWLVGKDVAAVLGYKNTKDALSKHVDAEDKLQGDGVAICDPIGRIQHPTVINESGVYSLVFGSKLPQAKEFKRWVTSEVLPAIRKHGGYLTPAKVEEALLNPDTLIQLATQLKQERERNKVLQAQADKLTADNTYLIDKRNHTTAALMVQRRTRRTANDFTITELAEEFDMSPKVLRDVLKAEGWLMQMDGKGFHYPTLKAPQGALYVEQGAYFSKMTQTVRISPYGVLCVKQLLKDKGLLGWYL